MNSRPRIVVVGLGPAGLDLMPPRSWAVLTTASAIRLRTARHPAVEQSGPDDPVDLTTLESFDRLYDAHDTFEEVYAAMATELVALASRHGSVAFVVPGSPLILERTVAMLSTDASVELCCHPAMSFLDLAYAALGVDPVEVGLKFVDGHRFDTMSAASGPQLVAHCHSAAVLSDIKLSADPPEGRAVLLWHLGLPEQRIEAVDWADIDRTVEADHLTSLYIPAGARTAGSALAELDEVVARLRVECPWDSEQTHATLRRYLVEETAEVLDAIDAVMAHDDQAAFDALESELGDLLFQVVFHSRLATEEAGFELADVIAGITEKLIVRHPHVFAADGDGGDDAQPDPEQLRRRWEQSKARENADRSAMDGIPAALPPLLRASKVLSRASGAGFDGGDSLAPIEDFAVSAALLRDDPTPERVGDALFAAVRVCRNMRLDPETVVGDVVDRFVAQFRALEAAAVDAGFDLSTAERGQIQHLWEAVGPPSEG